MITIGDIFITWSNRAKRNASIATRSLINPTDKVRASCSMRFERGSLFYRTSYRFPRQSATSERRKECVAN